MKINNKIIFISFCVLFLMAAIHSPSYSQSMDFANHILAGKELMGQHKYEEALASFKKAIALNPKSAEGYFYKANALYWMKSYKEADSAIQEALKRNDQYYMIWYYKGKITNARGNYKEALAYFEKTLEKNHLFKDAWFEKGLILYGMKQYRACIGSMGKVINLDSSEGRAYCISGMSYYWLGNMEQARNYITKGLSISPSYKEKIPDRIRKGVGL